MDNSIANKWKFLIVFLSYLKARGMGLLSPKELCEGNLEAGLLYWGVRGGVVVEALCYKSEGRGFDYRWCH
jgi:hypothetical protein